MKRFRSIGEFDYLSKRNEPKLNISIQNLGMVPEKNLDSKNKKKRP